MPREGLLSPASRSFGHFVMPKPAAMLTVQLVCHQVQQSAPVLPLLDIQTPHSQHGVDILPKLLADNRRNDALIPEHHPFRFQPNIFFLERHVLDHHLVPAEVSLVFWISDNVCHRRMGQPVAVVVQNPSLYRICSICSMLYWSVAYSSKSLLIAGASLSSIISFPSFCDTQTYCRIQRRFPF